MHNNSKLDWSLGSASFVNGNRKQSTSSAGTVGGFVWREQEIGNTIKMQIWHYCENKGRVEMEIITATVLLEDEP